MDVHVRVLPGRPRETGKGFKGSFMVFLPAGPEGYGKFMHDTYIYRAQPGARSRLNPFNNFVRNIEMKSIDKFVLVLVASLALLLAGCGGGSSSMEEPTEPPAVDPAVAERAAINEAIMMARTAVPGIDNDSTDSEVSAAETAIADARAAIAAATNVPAEEKAANTATVDTLAAQLTAAKTARMAAMDAADEAMAKAMAETGKLLHAALGGPQAGGNALANNEVAPTLAAAGLTINAATGAGALPDSGDGSDPAAVTLEAGDSAGSLNGWAGTDYAHSAGTGDAKVTNEARIYTNQGAPTRKAFTTVHTLDGTPVDGTNTTLSVDSTAEYALVMAAAFTHSGTQNHPIPANTIALKVRGTYDGAPGEYSCTGTCTSTNDGSGSPSALGGTWTFKPDSGAMVSQPDAHYLYYGWWVSKDSDGEPTAASAFAGRFGTDPGDSTDGLDVVDLTAAELTGSATYSGHAAGKFAMSNPLDGTGNGGHFTADANLEASFNGETNPGVTGTIDNFRLNDGSEDPGWSVSLARGALGATGITAPAADPTVWSINGNKAPASGTWSGTMYDEMPGNAPDGDGSNIPTTVTGTFYSEFSTIGRMVGAFGADKE